MPTYTITNIESQGMAMEYMPRAWLITNIYKDIMIFLIGELACFLIFLYLNIDWKYMGTNKKGNPAIYKRLNKSL